MACRTGASTGRNPPTPIALFSPSTFHAPPTRRAARIRHLLPEQPNDEARLGAGDPHMRRAAGGGHVAPRLHAEERHAGGPFLGHDRRFECDGAAWGLHCGKTCTAALRVSPLPQSLRDCAARTRASV